MTPAAVMCLIWCVNDDDDDDVGSLNDVRALSSYAHASQKYRSFRLTGEIPWLLITDEQPYSCVPETRRPTAVVRLGETQRVQKEKGATG